MPRTGFSRRDGLTLHGVALLHPMDLAIAILVLVFFVANAWLRAGDVVESLRGALLIMLVMFVVGAAVEAIIEALRTMRGLGTAVGFITNGPEALCLVVGLLGQDIIFAASTPLGSNFMNPLMLLAAALLVGTTAAVLRQDRALTLTTVLVTAGLAGSFFLVPGASPVWYWLWLGATVPASLILFRYRSRDDEPDVQTSPSGLRPWHAVPAALLLIGAGAALDPVVTLTAEASRAPKGIIGFFVLAALTSWPEFRSCVSLLRRGKHASAVLNITVSNLTNLWLAAVGVAVYQLVGRN